MLKTLLKIPYLRLKYRFAPNEAQAFWAEELLDSQGLGAKLGQVLTQGKVTRLPKSSMTSLEAKSLFEKSFGVSCEVSGEVLAASMGQVFFAEVKGEPVAMKILHPGIREKLESEIENILLLGGYFSKIKNFSFDKDVFRRFLQEVFEEETDLKREAMYQEKFATIFRDYGRIKIPEVIKHYSNESILCQEVVRCDLARDLSHIESFEIFQFFFEALFQHGILHGDLNDRNWGIMGKKTVIYDFGCSQIVSGRRTDGLKKLILNKNPVAGFKELGVRLEATSFKGREQELRDDLFGPLFDRELSPDFAYSETLQKKYGDKIKELREYTDPWVLLLMRSLFSVIRVYQDRRIPLTLGPILNEILPKETPSSGAAQIRIEVLEKGKEVVSLKLPLISLDNLEDLMPSKVLTMIHERNLDIPQIIRQAKENGLKPQDLFHLQVADRSYRVWLE